MYFVVAAQAVWTCVVLIGIAMAVFSKYTISEPICCEEFGTHETTKNSLAGRIGMGPASLSEGGCIWGGTFPGTLSSGRIVPCLEVSRSSH